VSDVTEIPGRARRTYSASLFRYLVIGLASFAIDFGTLYGLHGRHGWPLWVGTSAGFWLSFAFNFGANRVWTFRSRSHSTTRQLFRYSVLVTFNYVATVALVSFLTWAGLGYLVAKTFATAILTMSTFLFYRSWVFGAPNRSATSLS
jgi:putative flippase GtrA